MSIPHFDNRGLIPPVDMANPVGALRSPYSASIVELVQRFGYTPQRRRLLRNLIDYRALFASDEYAQGVQFIDGSFVEDVEAVRNRDPQDIDVFSLVYPPAKYVADFSLWLNQGMPFWEASLVNRQANKQLYSLDTYGIIVDDQIPIFSTMHDIMYWYGLFSHQRDTFQWKGFVALGIDTAEDQAALTLLEGMNV
ncbi:DUF6932 family protein [Agrobacterium rosae]